MATILQPFSLSILMIVLTAVATSQAAPTADPIKAAPDDEYIFTGSVTNSAGEPLAGAIVEWGDRTYAFRYRKHTTTDTDGRYQLTLRTPDLQDRRHDDPKMLLAISPGHIPTAPTVREEFIPGQQTRDFVLTPFPSAGHTVSGTVVDDAGAPIADARVEAFTPMVGFHSSFSMPTGRDYFTGPDRVTRTDAAGRFSISDLPDGEVQLSLRSPHRHVNDKNYPVQAGVTITMSGSGQPGQLQGRILDAVTGKPPAGAERIRIVRRYSTTPEKCCNRDGYFRLPSIATRGSGNLIYIYAPGYVATEVRLSAVAIDSETFVNIRLQPQPSLRGRILDADTGLPLTDVKLLYGVSGKSKYMQDYVSWSDLDRHADGHHALGLVQHAVSSDDGSFWFAEPPSISLRSAPSIAPSLSALLPDTAASPLAPTDETPAVCGTASNAASNFTKPGAIIVHHDGYQRLILEPQAREFDPATGELIIRLPRESAFTGVVTQHGRPLANVSVQVYPHNADVPRRQMFESVHTDADGRYTFGSLAPGPHTIHVGPFSRVANVGPSQTATVNLGDDLGPLRIHGTIDHNTSITLTPEFAWDYTRFSTTSDERGHYEITGLKPGKYEVSLFYSNRGHFADNNNLQVEVTHNNQQCDFSLRPPAKPAATTAQAP